MYAVPLEAQVGQLFDRACAHVRGRWIEIGCGTGRWSEEIQRRGVDSLILMDVSREAVARARFKTRLPAIVGACERPPVRLRFFDVVVSIDALSIVDDFRRALIAVQKLLKPGGLLLVTLQTTVDSTFVSSSAQRLEVGLWRARPGPFPVHYVDPERLTGLLANYGLRVRERIDFERADAGHPHFVADHTHHYAGLLLEPHGTTC